MFCCVCRLIKKRSIKRTWRGWGNSFTLRRSFLSVWSRKRSIENRYGTVPSVGKLFFTASHLFEASTKDAEKHIAVQIKWEFAVETAQFITEAWRISNELLDDLGPYSILLLFWSVVRTATLQSRMNGRLSTYHLFGVKNMKALD